MFPISELSSLDLSDKGLRIDPEDLFNANRACLVDGICRVNGCTGSFVSADGLIITNHHCAYRAIQSVSTKDRDYLRDGFQASKRTDELAAKGYTVRITKSFRDISDDVLSAVRDGMTFVERTKAIEKRKKELEKVAEDTNPGMRAEVAEMFTGKTYVLFLYVYLKDVRLVFAPPSSVGNFGGDVDNWEWPRHTGDFSFMRAYTAPDGSSADYSVDNVPYKPKRHIQVAPQGVRENDFVFLLGYPGRTARHKTSHFLRYEEQVRLPYVAEIYRWQIDEMDRAAQSNRTVAIKHSTRSRRLANVEKRSLGQLKGLRRAKITTHRAQQEAKLRAYIEADPNRKEKYETIIDDLRDVYDEMTRNASYELNFQQLRSACRMLYFAFLIFDSAVERQKDDVDREVEYMDRNFDQTIHRLMLNHQDLHKETDKRMLKGMLERLAPVAKKKQMPLRDLLSDPSRWDRFVNEMYDNSRLHDAGVVTAFLEMKPADLEKEDDAFIQLSVLLYPAYMELRELDKEREGKLSRLYGSLIELKQEFLKTEFVPDANGTLRLTFGSVRGYSPEDAVYKSPITTLRGAIDKTTGVAPFVTPERIVTLHEQKDFGQFAHPDLQDIPVAILYDTDTTGGNSGSPILNAQGQLVGVNFDRAYEATINDFAWNQNYSRSIGVDIRYALWITGKVYGANHLLKEMGILNSD